MEKKKQEKYPDAFHHKMISFLKSGIRLIGFLYLSTGNFYIAGMILAFAEIFGVLEEVV